MNAVESDSTVRAAVLVSSKKGTSKVLQYCSPGVSCPAHELHARRRALRAAAAAAWRVSHPLGVTLTPGNFIAGADINMLAACTSAAELQALSSKGQNMFNRLVAGNPPSFQPHIPSLSFQPHIPPHLPPPPYAQASPK